MPNKINKGTSMPAELITVNIKRLKDWYVATSDDLKELHVADPRLNIVIEEIPHVIKALYKANRGIVVQVEESKPDTDSLSIFPLQYTAKAA